jgi:hypothetical protein
VFRLTLGLLDTRYSLELVNHGNSFYFENCEDQLETEGIVASGDSALTQVGCNSMALEPLDTEIIVRWKKTESSPWLQENVKLSIEIGIPQFNLDTKEIDFKTIYLNGKRTVRVTVANNGTASCLWRLLDTERLVVTPTSGELLTSKSQTIDIEFSATDFDPLSEAIIFDTDVGRKTIYCVGIVGVSYLKIAPDFLAIDFGTILINKSHSIAIPITNTGRRDVEYEACLTGVQSDGIDIAPGDFDLFSIEAASGILGPGQSANIKMNAHPRDYNARITASFEITTKDEEEHRGSVAGLGGKAIIKILPPAIGLNHTDRTLTAEVVPKPESTGNGLMVNALMEGYMQHVENLQEILSCLQSEPDLAASSTKSSVDDLANNETTSKSVFDGSDTKVRRSKLRVAQRNAEKARVAKLSELGLDPKKLPRKSIDGTELELASEFTDHLNLAEEKIEKSIKLTANPPQFAVPSSFGRYRPGFRHKVVLNNGATSSDPYFNTTGEVNGVAGPLREIIQGLRAKIDALSCERDPDEQKILADEINGKILDRTLNILSAVKDKLKEEPNDVPDCAALLSATRKLQTTFHAFESTGAGDSANSESDTDFLLGKYKGDELSPISLLFNLPNVGNIAFGYVIRENDRNCIVPPGVDGGAYFSVIDPEGIVEPTESVTLSAKFQASWEGQYCQGYTIFSSEEPVLSFTLSAKVGRPNISLSPVEGIDFGLVVKGGQSSTSSILLKNVGSFIDSWRIQSHVRY